MLLPKNTGKNSAPKKPISAEAKRHMAIILCLTVALAAIYYGSMTFDFGIYVMWAYMIIFAVLLITFLAYNRAFVNKNVTVDMLPPDWSDEKKADFIHKNVEREKRSRWMLLLIIPFAFVFICEVIYLFLWVGNLENLFVKK
jgi:Ca2+/Na+ antiporter